MASEELARYKQEAEEYKQRWLEAKQELEEYQMSSQDLEAEMEMQLEQAEKKTRDLQSHNERLLNELDAIRQRFEEQHNTDLKQMNEQQDELAQLRAYKEELEKYIRELEQNNDDLERAKRETVTSLQDFESKLNQAIERNAFLESELDDKDYLMESIQRLKDEARDLRQELDVSKKKKEEGDIPSATPAVGKVKPEIKVEPCLPETPIRQNSYKQGIANGTPSSVPLTPTARISALNIVADLLRKVGALETKLNAVKNTVKDQSPLNKPKRSAVSAVPKKAPSASTSQPQGFLKISV